MKIDAPTEFLEYLRVTRETEGEVKQHRDYVVEAFRTYHRSFSELFSVYGITSEAVPALLAMNAFQLFLAAARTSMSGHAAAVYPILRTCLETACYAHRLNGDPDLTEIYVNRHNDSASMKQCRRKLGTAVADTAKVLQSDDNEWALLDEAYQSLIDFGAHPNVRSVFSHVRFGKDRPDGLMSVEHISVHGPNDHETMRAMLACLDISLVVIAVLATMKEDAVDELQRLIVELNDTKERTQATYEAG